MSLRRILNTLAGIAVLAGLVAAGYFTRDAWLPWMTPAASSNQDKDEHNQAPIGEVQQAKLTSQAQRNLRLVSKPVTLQSYWRTIQVPGVVVDRPGVSDRGVTAPIAGVVAKVFAHPGDTVRSGDRLFALRLISDSLQSTQTELFKATREIQITQELRKNMTGELERINPARALELDNTLRRLSAAAQASKQDLLARGLSQAHVESASRGEFITEMEVVAPPPSSDDKQLVSDTSASLSSAREQTDGLAYEVTELKVELGQQVQAGQMLCRLANHQSLYIEGHSFKREAPLLEQAAQNGWPVRVELSEDDANHWPALEETLTIRHLANSVESKVCKTFKYSWDLPLDVTSSPSPRVRLLFLKASSTTTGRVSATHSMPTFTSIKLAISRRIRFSMLWMSGYALRA